MSVRLWKGWVRQHRSSQALVLRCGIVLATADGEANVDIAGTVGMQPCDCVEARRRTAEFRAFWNQIDAEVPSGPDVHIVPGQRLHPHHPSRSNDGN